MSAFETRAATCDVIYALVPAHPLPIVDLSKSFRGRLLPDNVHTFIRRLYYKYYRQVLCCAALSYCINVTVPMVKASVGRIFSLLAVLLWLPLGLGSVTTMRYDIVRVVCRTFDFWFFSIVTSVIVITMSIYLGDLRSIRTFIDWFGYHHVICIDAHVLGLRSATYVLIAAVISALIGLAWIMLNQVDESFSYVILKHDSIHAYFELRGVDLIGNGLISLGFLLLKIIFRRRNVLRSRMESITVVECAIYHCRLKLEPVQQAVICSGGDCSPTFKQNLPREAAIIQHLMFVEFPIKFYATETLLPWKIIQRVNFSVWFTIGLSFIGATGLILSQFLLLHELTETTETKSDEQFELLVSIGAVICTTIFTATFVAFYQRQLVKCLLRSFDFAFYSFQFTAVNVFVCVFYDWDLPQCLMVLSWWIWAHWVFTLDALTPIMRCTLRFQIRFAAPILFILLLDHVAIIHQLFYVADPKLKDAIIFDGNVFGQHLSIRVIPLYLSRSFTLTLWCSRLVVRLGSASNDDVSILRGTVSYDKFNSKVRRNGLRLSRVVKVKALAAAMSRRVKISPVVS